MAVGLAAWLLFLLAGSELIRNRRAFAQASRQRAVEEQRSADEADRRRASEERLGIARELHDVVAHSLSLINVQAGVALELMDRRPEQVRTALTAIKQASRDALADVQSVLDSLRRPGEEAPRAPAPSLRDVADLVQRAEATGLTVDTQVTADLTRTAPRHRRGRVPDRAGGADQCGAARARVPRPGPGRRAGRRAGHRGR